VVRDVWHTYSDQTKVLRGVDLEVESGQILGLLGPSGAGKTTLLRLLSGLLIATRGEVSVAGINPAVDATEIGQRVGCVVRSYGSFRRLLTGEENLRFFAALLGLPSIRAADRCDEILAEVGLSAVARRPYHAYTDGMRQRLFIGRALLSDPSVLILDEPTSGLSPTERSSFYGFLGDRVRERGTTVVYATHDLNEAQFLCDGVALLHQGKIVAKGRYLDVRKAAAEVFRLTQAADAADPTYPGLVATRELTGRARRDRW
jgi:ABC-2 type transport system ATP-binding protein